MRCETADGKPLQAGMASSPEELTAYAQQCAEGLQRHTDPRYYTTAEAIGDLDAVRAALGAPRIDLIGVSYGTRVAQHYAKRYPAQTRAIAPMALRPAIW